MAIAVIGGRGAGTRGGIEFVEIEVAPGQPKIGTVRIILNLDDAADFYRRPKLGIVWSNTATCWVASVISRVSLIKSRILIRVFRDSPSTAKVTAL